MRESRAEEAKRKFIQEYARKPPYSEYINGVGYTSRAMAEWLKEGRNKSFEQVVLNLKRAKKNPNAPCLKVNLRSALPKDIKIPKKYHGFIVYAEVVGEIRPRAK